MLFSIDNKNHIQYICQINKQSIAISYTYFQNIHNICIYICMYLYHQVNILILYYTLYRCNIILYTIY